METMKTDASNCAGCGGESFHHTIDCYLGNGPVTDFNPERCQFTWTPHLNNGLSYPELRCTKPAEVVEHDHGWNSLEQYQWTELTKRTVIEALVGYCICEELLREGDVVVPCPVHGWSTH